MLAALSYALRSISQLINYFFFHQKRFESGTVRHEGQFLGQPWNVIVYKIENTEVRMCLFQQLFFELFDLFSFGYTLLSSAG
jgi:hypothetical protein